MVEQDRLIPPLVLDHLGDAERCYLTGVFNRYQGYPSLQQLWWLMDEQWQAHECDPLQIDGRVTAFYRHPVWLLNGLFIEQDPQSLQNRCAFTDWVSSKRPARLADFGGGFGGLARFIGVALPEAQVEVVEPHPHPAAIALAADTPNVRFVPELTGHYDLLIATDVFEHVPDPIGLAAATASHLRLGGRYLIANCFVPVIQCHLPQLFHLQIGWDQAVRALGLLPQEKIQYGRVYERIGDLNERKARQVEALARRVFPWIQPIPKGRLYMGKGLMRMITAMQSR